MSKRITLTVTGEKDVNGVPVFEVDGERFTYRGKSVHKDMIWQSHKRQIIFIGPDFRYTDVIESPEHFDAVATVK